MDTLAVAEICMPSISLERDRAWTAAQIRLAWTLSLGDHVLAIPGTSSPRHLEENIRAGSLQLSFADLAVLDGLVD